MTDIEFVFFDAGGGHRSSASALCEVIENRNYPWRVQMTNCQELLDSIDVIRRATGVRIEDVYNLILKQGWTLGARHTLKILRAAIWVFHRQQVQLFEEHWRKSKPSMVVSVIPHFNRALLESLAKAAPGVPFVTILTDIANYPPHFWIENKNQYFVCGSEKASQQAKEFGVPEEMVFQSSGMIIHPRFYEPINIDRSQERKRLGLNPDVTTGLVMFGGQGSREMIEILRRLESIDSQLQLILICGKNHKLADQLREHKGRFPIFVEGFTKNIPYYMHLSDFFIGKPGPGSISEALAMNLPVLVQNNAFTLPQERYNAQWIVEKQVGLVVKSVADIGPAVDKMLRPEILSNLKMNAARLNNRAVFEIPVMLETILSRASLQSTQGLTAGVSS